MFLWLDGITFILLQESFDTWKCSVEVLVIAVVPSVRRVPVWVSRGQNVEISRVNYPPDPLVTLVIVCQVSGENKKQESVTMHGHKEVENEQS